MPESGQKTSKDGVLYEQLLFSCNQAEEILVLLGNAGAPLPDRFYRPEELKKPDYQERLPASEFPLRKQWVDAIRETQDMLNSAASDVSQYEDFAKKKWPRERQLEVLKNAAANILQRLAKPQSRESGSFESTLFLEISERFGPFPEGSNFDEFLLMLTQFSSVVSEIQLEGDLKTKERLARLFSSDLTTSMQDEEQLTPQHYLVRRYTKVFEDLFMLTPLEYTDRQYNNYTGVYPDFIAKVMTTQTGTLLTQSTLTKALQRAATLKPKS